MPIVSLEELCFAAQQQFRSQYQVVRTRAQKPFVAQLVPKGAGPSLYIAQRQTRMSVSYEPTELDSCRATKLTRLLLYVIHLNRCKRYRR